MSVQESLVALAREQQEAIRRFDRARKAISGLDEAGEKASCGWFDKEVISLAHGEGIRRPHPSVVAAGVRALLDAKHSSLDNYMYLRPFHAFEEKLVETFISEGIDEQTARNLCIDSGNTRLFFGFFYAVANPGDIFLAPQTFYQAVSMWADISNVILARVETQRRNDYKFTRADLERWFDEHVKTGKVQKPKGLLLFNPGYTGALYTRDELEDIAEWVERHNLVVLEDAIFTGTEFEGHRTTHLASVPGMADRVVTVNGGSKAYGLANIRIGWGCGPADIIKRMNYYTMATSITVPHVAKAMALAALSAPKAYLLGNNRECQQRAALVTDLVAQTNAAVHDALGFTLAQPLFEIAHQPKAAHSTLLSCNGMRGLRLPDGREIKDSIDITRHFLSEHHVCFSPGFSNGFDDCTVRVSFGCLGSEFTYAETQLAEINVATQTILSELEPSITQDDMTARMQAAGIDPTWSYPADQNQGFAQGRALIQDAFLNRILPGAVKLALDNASRLSEQVGVTMASVD